MSLLTLILIAVSLAMDAFAVSVIGGATIRRIDARTYFRLAFHFGLFQFLMPLLGWLLSRSFVDLIGIYAPWAACALLLVIGGKMIKEGLDENGEDLQQDISRGWTMVSLSLATSIDALAIGVSLGLMNVKVFYPALLIGLIAGAFSILGIQIGRRSGKLLGNRIYILGGLILIAIGIKSLL